MGDERDGQTYCAWCHGDLSAQSIEASGRLHLDRELSWACSQCISDGAYLLPPQDWDGTSQEWATAIH